MTFRGVIKVSSKSNQDGPYEFEKPVAEATGKFSTLAYSAAGIAIAVGLISGGAYALDIAKQSHQSNQSTANVQGPKISDALNQDSNPLSDPSQAFDPNTDSGQTVAGGSINEQSKPHHGKHQATNSSGTEVSPPVDVIHGDDGADDSSNQGDDGAGDDQGATSDDDGYSQNSGSHDSTGSSHEDSSNDSQDSEDD